MRDYYDRLGVARDASSDDIAAAYRERLKETHPDVSDASDAEERTKRLIEAKEVLSDAEERSRYDRLGHEQYVSLEGSGTAAESEPAGHQPPGEERTRGERTASETSTDRTATEHTANRTSERSSERTARASDQQSGWSSSQNVGYSTGTAASGASADQSTRAGTGTTEGVSETAGGTDATTWVGGATAAGTSPGASGTGTTREHRATGTSTAGQQQNSSVAWYQGSEEQEEVHERNQSWDAMTKETGDPWRTWSAAETYAVRRGKETSGAGGLSDQALFLFGFTFVIYPILLFGTLFPAFPLAVRAVVGVCVLVVTAYLQSIPKVGMVVFGTWTVLMPMVLSTLGVALLSPQGALSLAVVGFPFGFSLLTWVTLKMSSV
jgi:molecular chaperone DnaJ